MAATKPKIQLMVGTEAHPDYLVVGRKKDLYLGVKPLLFPLGNNTFIGFRVRLSRGPIIDPSLDGEACLLTKGGTEGGTKYLTENDYTKGLDWFQKEPQRLSCMVGVLSSSQGTNPQGILADLKRTKFLTKAIDFVHATVGNKRYRVLDDATMRKVFNKMFFPILKESAQVNEATSGEDLPNLPLCDIRAWEGEADKYLPKTPGTKKPKLKVIEGGAKEPAK